MEITIDNKKMWELILRNHPSEQDWINICDIKLALKDQGLHYNSDTKKIESLETKPEYYKCIKEYRGFTVGKIYKTNEFGNMGGDDIKHNGVISIENPYFMEWFCPATPEEIPKSESPCVSCKIASNCCAMTCKKFFEYYNQKHYISIEKATQSSPFIPEPKELHYDSESGLTEFESEIAHILVYANNEPTDTDEERKRAYQKYAKNAKFFAPLLLEKARKQLQPEIDANIDKAYKNQDEVQYRNGYNKAVEDAFDWLYKLYDKQGYLDIADLDDMKEAIKGE